MSELEIYADGCDLEKTKELYNIVNGFTTNPTLMKKAGITNYQQFIKDFVDIVPDKPISFMVLSDCNYDKLYYNDEDAFSEARRISEFGKNIYVKIPIINTKGISNIGLIKILSNDFEIKVNITSVFTIEQINEIARQHFKSDIIVSIFAGRIANTGIDPEFIIKFAKDTLPENIKILWASSRELFNIIQAERSGCDIITLPYDLLNKLDLFFKDLDEYSRETTKMFYNDAKGYEL